MVKLRLSKENRVCEYWSDELEDPYEDEIHVERDSILRVSFSVLHGEIKANASIDLTDYVGPVEHSVASEKNKETYDWRKVDSILDEALVDENNIDQYSFGDKPKEYWYPRVIQGLLLRFDGRVIHNEYSDMYDHYLFKECGSLDRPKDCINSSSINWVLLGFLTYGLDGKKLSDRKEIIEKAYIKGDKNFNISYPFSFVEELKDSGKLWMGLDWYKEDPSDLLPYDDMDDLGF